MDTHLLKLAISTELGMRPLDGAGPVPAGYIEGVTAKTEDGLAFLPAAIRGEWMSNRQEPLDQNIGTIEINTDLAGRGATLQLAHTIVV